MKKRAQILKSESWQGHGSLHIWLWTCRQDQRSYVESSLSLFLLYLIQTIAITKSLTDAPRPTQEDQPEWEQYLAQSTIPALRAASQIDTELI